MDNFLNTLLKLFYGLSASLMTAAQGLIEKYGLVGFGWRFAMFLVAIYFAKRVMSWVFMGAFVIGSFLLFAKYFS